MILFFIDSFKLSNLQLHSTNVFELWRSICEIGISQTFEYRIDVFFLNEYFNLKIQ